MHFRKLKMIATSGFLTALECTKFVFGRSFAPDPDRELTALPRPYSWFTGALLLRRGQGKEGESEGKKWEGEGREGRGEKTSFRGVGRGWWGLTPSINSYAPEWFQEIRIRIDGYGGKDLEKTKVLRREWKTTRERSCDGKHSIMFNSVDVMMSHSKRKATVKLV